MATRKPAPTTASSPVRTATAKDDRKAKDARTFTRKELQAKATALIAESSDDGADGEKDPMEVSVGALAVGFTAAAALVADTVDLTEDL